MIKSVVRHVKFTPDVIDKLFLDDMDHHGLIFWFQDAVDYSEEMKKAINPKKK